ncbi:MAG TPA: metallophosphoesterase [Thermaerobacter sp.]
MRYVEVTLPETLAYIDLWCVSDIHRGHRLHDERAWHALLDRVASDPHAYMVLNGDLVEAALKSSRHGDVYRSMAPGEERRLLVRELEPVRDKILCITSGNHEARHKDSDEDPAQLIAERLGIEDRYDRTAVVLEVSFGTKAGNKGVPTSYTFYVTHGQGQGRRPGARINRMQELAWIIEGVDGYIMGHVHDPMIRIEYRHVADPRNRTVGLRPVAYVIAGSLLRYGDYAEEKMLAPNANTFPVLRLHQRRRRDPHKHMEAIMATEIRRSA